MRQCLSQRTTRTGTLTRSWLPSISVPRRSSSAVQASWFSVHASSSFLLSTVDCRCAANSISSPLRSLALAATSFFVLLSASSALVYRVDSNTSSNLFFRTMPSCIGQLLGIPKRRNM
jgi:hypothetical protein